MAKETSEDSDNKMGDLSQRLHDLSGRIHSEEREFRESTKPKQKSDTAEGYAKATKMIAEFVAGPVFGGALGYGLDYLLGTLPIFLIIFLLLGFGAGVLNLARSANKIPPAHERLHKSVANNNHKPKTAKSSVTDKEEADRG